MEVTSPLISFSNQWTGFYMIGTSAMKKLNEVRILVILIVFDRFFFWELIYIFQKYGSICSNNKKYLKKNHTYLN